MRRESPRTVVLLSSTLFAFGLLGPGSGLLAAQEAEHARAAASAKPRSALEQAVYKGKYPVQVSGQTGRTKPSRYGPARHDPSEGIPKHAYSPFDERRNREYPCPPGGCETVPARLIVKLKARTTAKAAPGVSAAVRAPEVRLRQALGTHAVARMEPVFRQKQTLRPGERITRPDGFEMDRPDLAQWYRVSLSDEKADVFAVITEIEKNDEVEWAEPDYLRRLTGDPQPVLRPGSPNTTAAQTVKRSGPVPPLALIPDVTTDPLLSQQWHLTAGQVTSAWSYLDSQGLPPGGSRDVIVAVIDTGVDLNHVDLAANLWTNALEIPGDALDNDANGFVDDVHGANVVSTLRTGDPSDDHGHGTHVAGIIAAQAGNHFGGVGVAYNTQIMAIKAAQYSGVLSSSDIAEGINYAVAQGADVINMSFGGYARSQIEEDALAVAFGQAVLVAAAGNDGKVNVPCPFGRDMYPAAYNWVLGVMARAQNPDAQGDYLAGFSNYDCSPRDAHEYELMAPGLDIWSTLPNDAYAAWDGTSMAAPVVAGIAALVRTKFADKDVYSSRFIMGQIATTGGSLQGYTPVSGLAVSFDQASAQAAVTTVPSPSLSYLQHWLFDDPGISAGNDDDGIVDAGETVDLAIVIRNHWGKADNVSVTLEPIANGATSPDPYVTMLIDTVDYGAIGSFNWDDNGLTYDSEGAISGVQSPFRFTVDPNTPNDHLIPLKLTLTARNGLNLADPTVYNFQSRFFLIVQRGRELPRIISANMALTKDDYWIVADDTLIETGVTVTVSEGTQIQFGSAESESPYDLPTNPSIEVLGTLTVQGTLQEPVEMFLGTFYRARTVRIKGLSNVSLSYCKLDHPEITVTSVDHGYFTSETAEAVPYWKTIRQTWGPYRIHVTAGDRVNGSFFHRMRGASSDANNPFKLEAQHVLGNLFNRGHIGSRPFDLNDIGQIGWRPIVFPLDTQNNVFLNTWEVATASWSSDPLVSTISFQGSVAATALNNAILNEWINPNSNYWLWVLAQTADINIAGNYWGTDSTTLIGKAIYDYHDEFSRANITFEPFLTSPPETAYPFVTDVLLSTGLEADATRVGAEPVTFTVSFNRDMDTTLQPQVSFGPDVPMTDYTIHPVNGGWTDARTWVGTFNITPITGDGYQLIRVAGARAADDHWLVTGDDAGRFRFEIVTSGTEAMNLQATGGEGHVDLAWTQDDFEMLAGYNLYRSTSANGSYERINGAIIPADSHSYRDTNVQPGQPYFYRFRVVKTDMTESDYSNTAPATPIDTIPPVIIHTPVTEAPPGLALTIAADVTDNVAVQSVSLLFRAIGGSSYQSRLMTTTGANRYTATIEGSAVNSPGIDYYIEASDGVSTVRSGRSEYPHQVTVTDRPVITTVSPNRGPATGGTSVTISGSNFKAGATVTFGGAVAGPVDVVSSNQITCVTPAHFPTTVDVVVTCGTQTGTLLNGFTFESTTASVSLPQTGGGQHAIVQVPVNASVAGLAAASLTVTFDTAVLTSRSASSGTLTPGWSLAANTSTPGQIRLATASPGGTVTGTGSLVILEFEVMGAPGSSCALGFSGVLFNDGAIPAETAAGSFAVEQVYQVSGTVRYWNGNLAVPGVSMTLSGDRVYTSSSGTDGSYAVGGAAADDYVLTPVKSDGVAGISAYDASLVLQHDAQLTTLTGSAAIAADINNSGSITSMDAFYILQKAVDLISVPFPGGGKVWSFSPASRTFTNFASNQTGQDFTGILLGDPSGNWTTSGAAAPAALTPSPARGPAGALEVALSIPNQAIVSGADRSVSVSLVQNPGQLYSAEIEITYDPEVVSVASVERGASIQNWMIASNLARDGVVRAAVAGATPITGAGELLTLTFHAVGGIGARTAIGLSGVVLNEGAVSVVLEDGGLRVVGNPTGYVMLGADGGVFNFGSSQFFGSLPSIGFVPAAQLTVIKNTPTEQGYYMMGIDGGIFAFGDAQFLGSLPGIGIVNQTVDIEPSPSGNGYQILGVDGGIFAFGDSPFYGSLPALGISISNALDMERTPTGNGYWIMAGDGGIFSFGDAQFCGSLPGIGVIPNRALKKIKSTATGKGYYLLGEDGGLFAFGDAQYLGSLPALGIDTTAVDLEVHPAGDGYYILGIDGSVYCFGNISHFGNLPDYGINSPTIVNPILDMDRNMK